MWTRLKLPGEGHADADGGAVDELPVAEADRLGVDADHLDAPRSRDHRRARLAADVLGERRDLLVDGVQVAPRVRVVVVDDLVEHPESSDAWILRRLCAALRAAAGGRATTAARAPERERALGPLDPELADLDRDGEGLGGKPLAETFDELGIGKPETDPVDQLEP